MNKKYYLGVAAVCALLSFASDAQDFLGGNFQLNDPLDEPRHYCFDLFGFGPRVVLSEALTARHCKNEGWQDNTFAADMPEQGQIYSPDYDMCLQAGSHESGAHLFLQACSDSNLQRFVHRENQQIELLSAEGARKFCVAVHPMSIPVGGGGNLSRSIQVWPCDTTLLELSQWTLPEEGGLAEPNVLPELVTVDIPDVPGASLYVSQCGRCHGVLGEGIESVQAPKLAGLSAWYLERQTDHFVTGVRGGETDDRWGAQMHYYISAFAPERISQFGDVANYIATLDDVPVETQVSGDAELGKQLYDRNCALCHGESGLGIEAVNAPRLAGMDDWYLLRQLQKFRDGRRGTHADDEIGALMVPSAQALANEQEMRDIISYINGL